LRHPRTHFAGKSSSNILMALEQQKRPGRYTLIRS
jgi:hypothetical protein